MPNPPEVLIEMYQALTAGLKKVRQEGNEKARAATLLLELEELGRAQLAPVLFQRLTAGRKRLAACASIADGATKQASAMLDDLEIRTAEIEVAKGTSGIPAVWISTKLQEVQDLLVEIEIALVGISSLIGVVEAALADLAIPPICL